MRVKLSDQVVSTDRLINQNEYIYSGSANTFAELYVIKYKSLDVVRDFSESSRSEFDDLRAQHF